MIDILYVNRINIHTFLRLILCLTSFFHLKTLPLSNKFDDKCLELILVVN